MQIFGSGSGVGSLADGNCDLANASRKMTEAELQRVREKRGVEPVEHAVGVDLLAIYVSKQNPLESISMEELAEIYGNGGTITKWSQLGVKMRLPRAKQITRVSRQNGAGSYAYFREAILGANRDYKLGSIEQSGSKGVVALVANTPSAIGYSSLAYRIEEVKILKISRKKGEPGVAATMENARSGSYPLTRPLQIYTVGEVSGAVKEYLDWILSLRANRWCWNRVICHWGTRSSGSRLLD